MIMRSNQKRPSKGPYKGLPTSNQNSNVVHELDVLAHCAARCDKFISF